MPTELLGTLPWMEGGGSHFVLGGCPGAPSKGTPLGALGLQGRRPIWGGSSCFHCLPEAPHPGWPRWVACAHPGEGGGGGHWLSSAPWAVRLRLSGCSQFPDGMGWVGMTGVWTTRPAGGPLRCGGAVFPCRARVGSFYKAQIPQGAYPGVCPHS